MLVLILALFIAPLAFTLYSLYWFVLLSLIILFLTLAVYIPLWAYLPFLCFIVVDLILLTIRLRVLFLLSLWLVLCSYSLIFAQIISFLLSCSFLIFASFIFLFASFTALLMPVWLVTICFISFSLLLSCSLSFGSVAYSYGYALRAIIFYSSFRLGYFNYYHFYHFHVSFF